MPRIVIPVSSILGRVGQLEAGGMLYFYENQSNPPALKPIFKDASLNDPAQNPVRLGDSAYAPDVYGEGAYTVACYGSRGDQLWARDNVSAGGESGGQFSPWSPVDVYQVGDISQDENGLFYQSVQPNNVGGRPSITPQKWSQIVFTKVWNEYEVYKVGMTVLHGIGVWRSKTDDNVDAEPSLLDTTNWELILSSSPVAKIYEAANVPSAEDNPGMMIIVAGNPPSSPNIPYWSDGEEWRDAGGIELA